MFREWPVSSLVMVNQYVGVLTYVKVEVGSFVDGEICFIAVYDTDAEFHLVRKEGGMVIRVCESDGNSPRLTSTYYSST